VEGNSMNVQSLQLDTDPITVGGLDSARVWDYENGYHWFSTPSRMHKMLAQYELYRQTIGLPGHVLEFGVYKAVSLIRLASYRQLLEVDHSRKIVGFDAFGGFPVDGLSLSADLDFVEGFEREGGDGLAARDVLRILQRKGFTNIDLISGNIFDTLPRYLEQHPELRVSYLHLDMDVKEPTELVLQLVYDRVVSGGLIVLDDYGTVVGETLAVDAFARERNLKIEKLSNYLIPAYIRKL